MINKGLFLIALLLFTGCMEQKKDTHLRIAVASNMQEVMKPLAKLYAETYKITYEIISSSSGKLTAQIKAGAPYDIFISADANYAQTFYNEDLTSQKPYLIAKGILILWTMDEALALHLDSLESYDKIALPNPKVAPFGKATQEFLEHQEVWNTLQDQLVFGESVGQTNQFILSGAAIVGFTSKSVLYTPKLKQQGQWIEIDNNHHSYIQHAAIPISDSQNSTRFCKFMLSKDARSILRAYGYLIDE